LTPGSESIYPKLETLGIVSTTDRNKGKGGGKYKLHSRAQSIESVQRGLADLFDGPAQTPPLTAELVGWVRQGI